MFGNIGFGEMMFILVVLLLLFGAKRLPEIGSSLGKGIREFKRSVNDIQGELTRPDDTHQVRQAPPPSAAAPLPPVQPPQQAQVPTPVDHVSSDRQA
jgi:sec-independent protein translocase protein TatA